MQKIISLHNKTTSLSDRHLPMRKIWISSLKEQFEKKTYGFSFSLLTKEQTAVKAKINSYAKTFHCKLSVSFRDHGLFHSFSVRFID